MEPRQRLCGGDEVLTALCVANGRPDDATVLLAQKAEALKASIARGNPSDDLKKISGSVASAAQRLLDLRQTGSGPEAFARNVLAPLIKPGMKVYAELKRDVFGEQVEGEGS